ncbi:ste ste11 protein kinase [Diplodia corticola]|uniref:mitogen-activated protein kinase n=1 Tax=Diplodia corticola TaxID=236234 RepID=A0A1J9RTR7_9PEZI|nr:ste ste11 protein kinase [Diplodia corticola]OJD35955.1 ste ste11 protein kinase [Diplodia corticola]
MAMLASKSQYVAPMGNSAPTSSHYPPSSASHRHPHASATAHHGTRFASPTESEFSETYDAPDSVKNWDEDRVGEWLKTINCAQYIQLFKENNINGEVLMEMDQSQLKEMGIKKIGDRVRIGSQAKLFRNKEYRKSKRNSNRESLAILDSASYTPPSSGSPRPLHSARGAPTTSRPDKRMSRQIGGADWSYTPGLSARKQPSRPGSPLVDQENRGLRPPTSGTMYSPKHSARKDDSYFGQPLSANSTSGRGPSPSQDASTNSSALPTDKALIRVIYDNGRSSVIDVKGFRSAEDIMLQVLRKGTLNEAHVKNYCFYVLDGAEPNPALCRKLSDVELMRVCNDRSRMERNRLILRKVHAGEPEDDQLKAAANIAAQQHSQLNPTILPSTARGQLKIEKLTGESLAAVSYPLSPASQKERERHINSTAKDLERADTSRSASRTPDKPMKQFYGGRPPSNLITSDLASYFPDVEKDEMDKTIRMSVRRSRRLSKAASRLSTLSNFSVASSLKDAPPLPSIADQWLNNNGGQVKPLRPLSVMRLGLPSLGQTQYRDSITSSVLEPLEEESPTDGSSVRKSYVSFGGDSGSDTVAVTDPDGHTTMHSYFDDGGSSFAGSSQGTEAGDSFNKRLSSALAEDGEEYDEELEEYLETDSWENVKYMKGALIGQGSFGSVYLALHAVTGELMAVKQVALPTGGTVDPRKASMLDALKREIGLLRELKHPNIVQYLGSNSDETHLNIFLEYVPGGSVATMLVNYGPLLEPLVANFVRQILTGLAYLHSKEIIHRDIKGANILVDNKGRVKISDFGISKRVEASTLLSPTSGKKGANRVSLQGSVFWMAPEVVKQTAYTRKADIWSLGCLIVEMLTGSHPHADCSQLQAIFRIGAAGGNASPNIPENASEDLQVFLGRTFEIEHEKRPSADELLESEFCAVKA